MKQQMSNYTEKMSISFRRLPSWVIPMCLAMIFVFGILLRFEGMRDWQANHEKAFCGTQPMLANVDGYYYLRIARDLVEKNYHGIDFLRTTPDHPERATVPPLLSVITAILYKITGLSFNWIAVLLPPVLGVFLVFPLYGLGKEYSGSGMGLVAALIGVISNVYFIRTSVGWYDTDCMNVTFLFTGAYCFCRFGSGKGWQKSLFLFFGFVNYLLFLWWWDMARPAVTILSLLPLCIIVMFYFRPGRKVGIVFVLLLFLLLTLFVSLNGWAVFENIITGAKSLVSYVLRTENGHFPGVGQLVDEQRHMTIGKIAEVVTGSYVVLLLGGAGLLLLICQQPKRFLFLIAPLLLSFLALFSAQRLLIFFSPLLALGFGFLIVQFWSWRLRFNVFRFAVPVLIGLVVWINTAANLKANLLPKLDSKLAAGFQAMGKELPQGSVVWAWWHWGHPLTYWSHKAVITDGAAHDGELSVYNAIPYTTPNPRLAANFIKFYVMNGKSGMNRIYNAVGDDPDKGLDLLRELMGVGPLRARDIITTSGLLSDDSDSMDEWLSFLFPAPREPVYFLLDYSLGRTVYWWYWLGTWNIAKQEGVHSKSIPFYNVVVGKNGATNNENFYADFRKGDALLLQYNKSLKSVAIYDQSGFTERMSYDHEAMAYLEIFVPGQYAVLHREDIKESVFNKLFLRHEKSKFFLPVYLNTPVFQIYEVVGDIYDSKLH